MPSNGPASILETLLSYMVGLLLLFLMIVTCIDVAGRYGFNAPLHGANEITELTMGVLIFAALPLVTLRSEHITISLLDPLFKGRVKIIQQLLVQLISALVLGVMSWRLWRKGVELASYNDTSSYLQIPLAPLAYVMSVMTAAGMLIELFMLWQSTAAPAAETTGS
jgi:TRAP-type C4-dicarboxylate transport system permease small subunit